MERVIAAALDEAHEPYVHDSGGATLDFYLSQRDVYIEVKRMHSPRIAQQMAKADSVIAVQGVGAVTLMASLIRNGKLNALA